MVLSNLDKYVYIDNETIVCSRGSINKEELLRIKYKIDKENKEIRLYDVPRVLTFQEKSLIYYAILDNYYFYPLSILNKEFKEDKIEDYIVKENGYSYHKFNGIDEVENGILGELIFEIPRQKIETEKLARIRDIYELLIRNIKEIGNKPICISFNGIMPDFKDVYRVIIYIFSNDKEIKKKKDDVIIFKRNGFLCGNKRIYILPKNMEKNNEEKAE